MLPTPIGQVTCLPSAKPGYVATVLSVHDGNTPGWFTASHAAFSSYLFPDDVILQVEVAEDLQQITAMNRLGEELWTSDLVYPSTGGDRLPLLERNEAEESSRLFEADPHTGSPVNGNTYEGDFYDVQQTRVAGVFARGMNAIAFLDEEWTLDLEKNQSVDRVGKHLIVTDNSTGTIHGLWSSMG